MAVTFYGNGVVYIPNRNRYIRFAGGEYKTADADEIAVLAIKYKHDTITESLYAEPVEYKPKRGRKPNAERNS